MVLADDHDLVRSGIKALLSTVEGVQVIAEARNGNELLQLLESVKPDVVMTDISMPGMDGITAIAEIHTRFPDVKVIVLSMYDTVDFVKRAVANGACGYLMKDAPPFELEQALRSVMATGSYFSAAVAQRLLQPSEPTVDDELTTRQVEILTLIAQGQVGQGDRLRARPEPEDGGRAPGADHGAAAVERHRQPHALCRAQGAGERVSFRVGVSGPCRTLGLAHPSLAAAARQPAVGALVCQQVQEAIRPLPHIAHAPPCASRSRATLPPASHSAARGSRT